jgi:hypothetical protein
MSNICGLTREEVVDLDRRDRVPLGEGGRCQVVMSDGRVCNQPLPAHPLQQGKYIVIINFL